MTADISRPRQTKWEEELICTHCGWTIRAEGDAPRAAMRDLAEVVGKHVQSHEGDVNPIEMRWLTRQVVWIDAE